MDCFPLQKQRKNPNEFCVLSEPLQVGIRQTGGKWFSLWCVQFMNHKTVMNFLVLDELAW